ncbi:cupin domain-containing protein [Paraburkholderia sp. CNPSo 3076]|uniref:cupin domain-containing protein n=1 Tax=Paraburkholderia sp. CNPSo 3076 TaxID=2940936 RepID=UPI00224FDB90|nr:cupin domain-containing protein [Paraburkholderia sp. CNPSo 3076]MCX5544119.1 cupin domain-containing protein [Paraburkholderia sp. CNPSo 3076]
MAFKVRRVVAGHNDTGAAIVISDEVIPAVSRGVGRNITGSEIWSTDTMPVDISADAESRQRKGYIKVYNDYNYVGSGQGTTFRITHWEPGHALFPHRTQTIDYDIVLSGEIDLELEGGQVVHLKAGDVVVLRGCTHTWINRSDKPAVTAFMLIDAAPFEIAGEMLKPFFPVPIAN